MAPFKINRFVIASVAAAMLFSFTEASPKKPVAAAATSWALVDNWSGSSFFNNFDFFTAGDPTHGFVKYVDQNTANANGLLSVSGSVVNIYSDHTNVASSAGRMSVRLTSKKSYNSGLFIFDVKHMPYGCGNWPAIWTVGPNWPNSGEIDIIEGVNTQSTNLMTLHTSSGCTITGTRSMTGNSITTNCDVNAPGQSTNQGCSVSDTSTLSYGQGFNNNGGGVFATQWTSSGIKIWFFRRGAIPGDITSNTPNPSSWGAANADFPFTSCSANHFANHQIVIDNTFCGDWAGAVFGQTCSGSCVSFVQNNPSAFTEAYWSINSFKVYQQSTTTATSQPTTTPPASGTCNGQAYDPAAYVCVGGTTLCPTTAPNACGKACYNSSQYKCCNGQLAQLSQTC